MLETKKEFGVFVWRITASHMVSYLFAGLAALVTLQYEALFSTPEMLNLMRPINSPWVSLGLLLQSINGMFMAMVMYPFRKTLFEESRGWIKLFFLIVGLTIFNPQAPAPGNFEGVLYTNFSWMVHLLSLPELFLYTILFSSLTVMWYKKPKKSYTIIAMIFVALMSLMSIAALLESKGILQSN